jgi:DNA-binding response OmpR family regulator
VRLTPIEYTLLSYLTERCGKVCSFQEIIQQTHGFEATDAEAQQLLKPHIHNLRQKLEADYVVSYRGRGYALINPEE